MATEQQRQEWFAGAIACAVAAIKRGEYTKDVLAVAVAAMWKKDVSEITALIDAGLQE
jgi:hypothetical protein